MSISPRSGARSSSQGDAIAHQNGKRFVGEHETKALLAKHAVPVPRGTTDMNRVRDLRAPLVAKAFGPDLVHKSDVGAVRLGLEHADVDVAISELRRIPGAAGVLVEEQAQPGTELLVGVVDRGFGPTLAIGMGGTLTEVFDDVVLRMLPVAEDDIVQMLQSLRSREVLSGFRGKPGIDQQAFIKVVLGICALADELGSSLAGLECNPVIASASGAVAVDARLILDTAPPRPVRSADFTPLFAPRGVAVAGASATKQTFGNRFLDAYRAMGWTEHLAAIHPSATDIDGVPAFTAVDEVPFPVDYFVAAVPAPACADLVRSAAQVVPFVHVISGGFSEASVSDGHDLEADLLRAAVESGVRVLGPNCMGVYSSEGRQTFQLDAPREVGSVSIISQSGGLAGDVLKVGAQRGLRFSKLVTVGNAIDVTPGELCEWLVDDPATDLIGIYVEDPRDGQRLATALRRAAAAGKPCVVLAGGLSKQGGRAVASHTGSLAGDERVWRAVSQHTGASVVSTLEDLLGALTYLQRYLEVEPAPGDTVHTLVVGVGGGASVLATDACDRAGLHVTPVEADIQTTLRSMGYGAGTSVANPIEVPFGPAAPVDALERVLTPVLSKQPYRDVLVHVNVQSFFSFATDGADKLLPVIDAIQQLRYEGTRIAFVPRNLEIAPGALVDELLARARDAGVTVFRTADEAAVAIAAAQHADHATRAR